MSKPPPPPPHRRPGVSCGDSFRVPGKKWRRRCDTEIGHGTEVAASTELEMSAETMRGCVLYAPNFIITFKAELD
ncbi:hypothetical protein E2C01_059010 [Portunus trituberculatus]|uniref:Uncharacterized protein n=1 Tax=Portunus trituberculatus TaxID=210409 RepID=A0A5B7H776_PORTR|nr:hypothetical protein [Portunus trituberculatus]